MKIWFIGICLLSTSSWAATRGEVVSVVSENSLKVRDEKGTSTTIVLDCLDNQKVSAKNKKLAKEFLAYKTKGKVLIWEKNQVLVNGVDNLALKALEWGILPLSKQCTDEAMVTAQSLGKQRKTGIWADNK